MPLLSKKNNFWNNLKSPFTVLAPMEDVTDTVFRQIVTSCGRPDVYFTEFTNCEGIQSKGKPKIIHRLQYTFEEHPIVAQIWGLNPENYYKTATLANEMGFDGIDINMGCPEKSIVKNGACSALINNPHLASEIISATKTGAQGIPVSVKTRIGFKTVQTKEWIGFLLTQNLDALTIHGRTTKEMSLVPAHWDEIGKGVMLRDKMKKKTIIIGNGDVMSLRDAHDKARLYGLDGVMIGRGIFYNPWLFNQGVKIEEITKLQRLSLLLKHTNLFTKTWGTSKNFSILKKFFKIYIRDFDGAGELREKLMETKNSDEVARIVRPEI